MDIDSSSSTLFLSFYRINALFSQRRKYSWLATDSIFFLLFTNYQCFHATEKLRYNLPLNSVIFRCFLYSLQLILFLLLDQSPHKTRQSNLPYYLTHSCKKKKRISVIRNCNCRKVNAKVVAGTWNRLSGSIFSAEYSIYIVL